MMNILITFWGRHGGGAKYSEEILKTFHQLLPSKVFASFSTNAENFRQINTITCPSMHIQTYTNKASFLFRLFSLPLTLIKFHRFLKQNNIRYIYTTMPHLWTPLVILICKLSRANHILTIHDAIPHPGDSKLIFLFFKSMLQNSSKIIVLSEHTKIILIQKYQTNPEKIIISTHGLLEYQNLKFSPKALHKDVPLRLVFFGRILDYKGLEYLIQAQIELERLYCDKTTLEIYGNGNISKYVPLLNQVKNLKLENRWIDDEEIYTIFSDSCLNIAPYIEASQSGTIPIALSCGIPSIATNIGGLPEQIQHNKTGIIVSIDDIVGGMVRSISLFLNNSELYEELSKNCIDFTKNELLWEPICLDLINSLDIEKR